jgi:hypothetical protein
MEVTDLVYITEIDFPFSVPSVVLGLLIKDVKTLERRHPRIT